MREVEERKLVVLILKGQGGLRQTSVAVLNIDTDVTNKLKWRLCKAAQQLQIPLIFVGDDAVVTARNELVQKCLCLDVRHEPQNVEQALRRVMQRNGLNMSEACPSIAIACGHDVRKAINAAQLLGQRSSSSELPTADLSAPAACHQLLLPGNATDVPFDLLKQDGEELCRALQRLYLTFCGESFETLDQYVFVAEAMALGDVAECAASHTVWATDTSDSITNGFFLEAVSALRERRCDHSAQACPMESPQMIRISAALIATLSTETSLPKGRIEQPLDRSQSCGAQDGGLLVTNSSPTKLASKAVAQDDTDELDCTWKIRMSEEGRMNKGRRMRRMKMRASSCVETIMEKIDWKRARTRRIVRHQRKSTRTSRMMTLLPLDSVLALDANDAASDNEVVKEAETAIVEGDAVDFPEVDFDRKHEATLRDFVAEEVLVPTKGAPLIGWRVDRFPQGPGRMRLCEYSAVEFEASYV